MRKSGLFIVAFAIAAMLSFPSSAQPCPADRENDWILIVKSNNTNPERSREFNDWYDTVDVPAVLAVDGYRRARRGEIVIGSRGADASGQGQYLALYDIRTGAIDRAIVDMLMTARQMARAGQSSDLLDVVEGVYYKRHSGPILKSGMPRGGQSHLVLVGVQCCVGAERSDAFEAWYARALLPSLKVLNGFSSLIRYQRYRVLTGDERDVPEILLLMELDVATGEIPRDIVRKSIHSAPMADQFVTRVSAYRKGIDSQKADR